jgi:wyosine [tRNA(Phe)-imidazoG37] synthetase (radical SAM superfamily)
MPQAGNNDMKKFLYGPVPSRRLGRSLGIDVVPYKVCTYDCIYCHVGRTTDKTVERKEYVPLDSIVAELDRSREVLDEADYVTIAGSGEPTLYARIGELIDAVKVRTRTPVAVITNGSLLWDAAAREDLKQADLVIPSLDAGNAAMFQYINRPHPAITFERMVAGLIEFRLVFKNSVWLEVLFVGGATGIVSEVRMLADIIRQIRPDKVQVNTVVRPPSEDFAAVVVPQQLQKLADLLGENTEVIAEFPFPDTQCLQAESHAEILAMLKRRPCTLDDIVAGMGINRTAAVKQIDQLVRAHAVSARRRNGRIFYAVSNGTAAAGAQPPGSIGVCRGHIHT